MKKAFTLILIFTFSVFVFAENRNALLIANGKYKNFGSLATPVKESKDLKKALEKLGFSVTIVENGSREKIIDNLYDFQKKLEKSGGIGFFHYGGHAVQVSGKNYLIPVDADIPDERRISSRAVDVDEVMASMQGDTNIIILDACRNNPLPAASGRSATRGLVLTEYKPKNSIIVYSAQPGKVAQDGVFTPILTEKLLEKKSFSDVLMDVRRTVRSRTNNEQSPGEYNELEKQVFLAGYVDDKTTAIIQSETKKNENNFSVNDTRKETNPLEVAKKALDEGMYSVAFEEFLALANKNNADAQYYVGYMYQYGYGVENDYKKAKKWYEKAITKNQANAYYQLGYLYENSLGIRYNAKNLETAVKLFEKASLYGNSAEAQNELGKIYIGYFYGFNYAKAKEWFEKSAGQGYGEAQVALYLMYSFAENDATTANKWFEKFKNDAKAQYSLGLFYEFGNFGTYWFEKDLQEAAKWYEKSAAQGYPQAVEALNRIAEDLEKIKIKTSKTNVENYIDLGKKANDAEKYTEAFGYFQKAADMGNSTAQSWLGYYYRYGIGTKRNFTKAIEYFEKAAKQGDAYSARNLAENYEYGFGIEAEDAPYGEAKDFDNCFYWYKKAAMHGDVKAQLWLGSLYSITYRFFGIQKNNSEAYKWYKLAAEQGDDYAKQRLKELN